VTIDDLDTPALLVDLDVMERNLARMADYARSRNLRLRPHTKTHKSIALAKRQLALGAVGLTVAKPGEAEVLVEAGPPELLVAYPTVGERKLRRLMEVARRTRLVMSLDSLEVAEGLSRAASQASVRVGVLIETDVGLHRVGVAPAEVDALAAAVERLPGLEWDGIAFYPGHIKSLDRDGLDQIARLGETVGELAHRLKPRIVSGGSTPTWEHSHEIPGMNEIRPGTYIFNDRNSVAIGSCVREDCAASILVTVVSTAVPGQAIIDGGSKTFSSDRLVSGGEGHGEVVEWPGAMFSKMNEEHGFVKVIDKAKVGDRVRVVPNHICVAVNLEERIYGVRGRTVEEIWTVDARAKLQ
jgi:D-serine deaminase-like pyridoxal phosphate-dependent protein